MSQGIWSSIDPTQTSGVMLAALLVDFKDAWASGFSGTSRPSNLQAGGMWIDTTNQGAPTYAWSLKIYTGSTDIEVIKISVLNGIGGTLTANGTFTVKEVAADTVGAILQMVKNRILNNGQVLTGDAVAEVRWTGRTITSTDPTVAYLKFAATDNEVTATTGGTFSMWSTPDALSTISEHLRFIEGQVETVVPHQVNSLQPVSQNVSTAATIAQLNADYMRVEMTGATATALHGVDAAGDSKTVTIHNRSTALVTLKHEGTSASAVDRIKMPNSRDYYLYPEETATLYYCDTDARWKIAATTATRFNKTVETIQGAQYSWTVPTHVRRANVKTYGAPLKGLLPWVIANYSTDIYGNMYAWGFNPTGSLGVGDTNPRSSPVAVLGSLQFTPNTYVYQSIGYGNGYNVFLDKTGAAYAWGINTNGQLGLGDVTSRSSPVAVLGGLKFSALFKLGITLGLTPKGDLYAWGANDVGELGVGDRTPRSSPVAVVGGLKFKNVFASKISHAPSLAAATVAVFGLANDGSLYAWGDNTKGKLGVGDSTNRSSPVAVLGSLSFRKVVGAGESFLGLTSTGVLYAWGRNDEGQLGVGDVTSRSSPVAVLNGTGFKDIDAGDLCFFGIKTDGSAYAWGSNSVGQLGVASGTSMFSSPILVAGSLSFRFIDANNSGGSSNNSVFGITTSGDAYAWGYNASGQLGVGNRTDRQSPVLVLGSFKWAEVGHVSGNSIGLTVDGAMYAWGENSTGNLGVGDVTNRSSPVAVLGATAPARRVPMNEFSFDVTPGDVISIKLANAESLFGNNSIGENVDSITVEYDN